MSPDPTPPSMPTDGLDAGGWVRTEVPVETVFSLPGMQVRSVTAQYEDERTRQALASAIGPTLEVTPRFFAGTRLVFDPPLPAGVSPDRIAPFLRRKARSTFATRLRERGLVDVERGETRGLHVGGGTRSRVTRFDASIPLPGAERDLPLACWVAPWTTTEDAILVTGGHPTVRLAEFFDLDTGDETLTRSGESYREEFVSLLRAVE